VKHCSRLFSCDLFQCTDYDLDYGTECLHLAQRYGNARVSLIDGPDNLWKVYNSELFTYLVLQFSWFQSSYVNSLLIYNKFSIMGPAGAYSHNVSFYILLLVYIYTINGHCIIYSYLQMYDYR